jgi:DNA mismatch repair protein MutS
VKREVTRVITPGTVLEEGMLSASQNNFLASVVIAGHHWGLGLRRCVHRGIFHHPGERARAAQPGTDAAAAAEVLVPTDAPDLGPCCARGKPPTSCPIACPASFATPSGPREPTAQTKPASGYCKVSAAIAGGLGCDHLPLAVRAAGGLLHYLEDTQKGVRLRCNPQHLHPVAYLVMDHQTRRNLEITQTSPRRHLQRLPAVGLGPHGHRHGGAHAAALAAATTADVRASKLASAPCTNW